MTDERTNENEFVAAHDAQAGEIVKLVTKKTDADIAADLKLRVAAAMKEVCLLFDEAQGQGFTIQWGGFTPQPPTFKHTLVGLTIMKIL